MEIDIMNEYVLNDEEEFGGRDLFLDFSWDVDPALLDLLGLQDEKHGAMRFIIAATIVAHHIGKSVAYSRRKCFYSKLSRYCGFGFTYRRVIKSIKILEDTGYVYNWIAPPRPPIEGRQGVQSTICATQKLLDACRSVTITPVQHECIWLRDCSKKVIDYEETKDTYQMRREIQSINSVMSEIDFDLPIDGVWRTDRHIIIPHKAGEGKERIDLFVPYVQPRVRRVFCRGSFNYGGRLYGPWQGIPSEYRKYVTINGEPTAEPDFKSIHPKLAYALAGCPLREQHDSYDTDDRFDRNDYKYALLIILNARHSFKAIHAIRRELTCSLKEARSLYDEVCFRNSEIAQFIAKDKGVELQRIDSDIALKVIRACHMEEIPVLPVHDSFIVPKQFEERTKYHMKEAWREFIDTSTY